MQNKIKRSKTIGCRCLYISSVPAVKYGFLQRLHASFRSIFKELAMTATFGDKNLTFTTGTSSLFNQQK